MKILFGGTFDPPHNGHIQLALHIASQLQHKVHFLPLNGVPNYKPVPLASLSQRLAMLNLIIEHYSQQLAIDKSELAFPNYSPTYLTLRRLRLKYGNSQPLYFIIGGDSLATLDSWDHWQQLFSLTNFIVAQRPNYLLTSTNHHLQHQIEQRLTVATQYNRSLSSGQIILSDFTPMNISSTQIRNRCKAGLAIDSLVPPAINSYIQSQQLYST